jgi:phosphoserine phosphatase RsbU/P
VRGETVNEQQRVLIVDDTPANIKVLHNLLREDYALSVATSGEAALEIAFSDERPDLVLLDVMMPEMDGHEVCRRLKADSRTRDVPIIFVTAMSEVEDETKGFNLGAVDYITKPIRPPIVEARVATHLELARTRQTLAQQNASMRADLALAAKVQESLLPKLQLAVPGLEVAGWMHPSDAVGGDYLDFLSCAEFGGRGLGVVVGDISGHGTASALLMTAARAMLRIRATQPGNLAEIIGDLNRRLAADVGGTGKYMTLFLAQVNDSVLTWVRAGHEPGMLLDPVTGAITDLRGEGMIVGIMPNEEFEELSISFANPGSVLVVTTDGITEAVNESDDYFGRERLKQSLLTHARCSAQGILEGVLADVAAFVGDTLQPDDVTLVIVKRT